MTKACAGLLLIAVVFFSTIAFAGDFYVAPGGSNANPGTLDSPWQTIQYAADQVQAGDWVWIRGGTYAESVTISRSGTTDAPIVFAAYAEETALIDGTDIETGSLVRLEGVSYVELRGLEIANVPGGNAIWITDSSHFSLVDCTVHHAFFGIGIANGSHDFLLEAVVVHDVMLYGVDVDAAGGAPCFNGTFVDCIVHTASDPEQNCDGFALGHGDQYGFEFINCRVAGVFDGFDISARGTLLTDCFASDCTNGGYKLWQDGIVLTRCVALNNGISNVELDWDGTPGTVTLDHCTLVGVDVFNIWVENAADTLQLSHSIVAGSDNIGLCFEQRSFSGYVGDFNLFHTWSRYRLIAVGYHDEFSASQLDAGAWSAMSGQDAHSQAFTGSLDDLFIDIDAGDLRLRDRLLDLGAFAPSDPSL